MSADALMVIAIKRTVSEISKSKRRNGGINNMVVIDGLTIDSSSSSSSISRPLRWTAAVIAIL